MNSSDRSNHPINVFEMMERLGIEGGGGVLPGLGLAYASALRTCHQCERGEACHEWLKVVDYAPFSSQVLPERRSLLPIDLRAAVRMGCANSVH